MQPVVVLLDMSMSSTLLKQSFLPLKPSDEATYYLKNRFLNQWLKWNLDPVNKYVLAMNIGFEDYILWNITPEIINQFDKSGHFFSACVHGFIRVVIILIQNGFNDCEMGFELACRAGHVQIVKLIISKGVKYFGHGFSNACANGRLEVVKLLIGEDYMDGYIMKGFTKACTYGHTEIVKLMLNDAADHCFYDFELGYFEACSLGHVEIVKLMISKFSTSIKKNLARAVYYICYGARTKIDALVLNKALNFYEPCFSAGGDTEGHCCFTNVEVMKLIIEQGLTPDELKFALYDACASGCLEIVKVLIVAGAPFEKNILLRRFADDDDFVHQHIVQYFNENY